MSSIVSLEDYISKKKKQQDEEFHRNSEFAIQAWNTAVENERYLPRPLAVKLILQTLLDHGLRINELRAFFDEDES